MGNYDDFDLDLKQVKNGNEPRAVTLGPVCTAIITSWAQGCSDKCKTIDCSNGCPVPSVDYPHHSCNGPLNDGTIQIMC
ncbi:hypothetical protein SDC9_96837 [bioreactor metagenome]|uniref:Uncharacterized protein n=1 Tax=bioreactor metagenome TaxID=1076179 RepID=A0A645AA98_9ZZZZ